MDTISVTIPLEPQAGTSAASLYGTTVNVSRQSSQQTKWAMWCGAVALGLVIASSAIYSTHTSEWWTTVVPMATSTAAMPATAFTTPQHLPRTFSSTSLTPATIHHAQPDSLYDSKPVHEGAHYLVGLAGLAGVSAIAFASGWSKALGQRQRALQLQSAAEDDDVVQAEPLRRIKVYTIDDNPDAACVRLANGEYHSLQPDEARDDDEADAFTESFDDSLPECFDPNKYVLVDEDSLFMRYQEVDFGIRSENLGSMTALGPPIETLSEAATILREEADGLDDMHAKGWIFEGIEEGWCTATTAVVEESKGRARVYTLPDDDAAAAVKLATGEYHILRPRTEEDQEMLVDNATRELDDAWERLKTNFPGEEDVTRPGKEEEEEDFRYVEAIEATLVPPFDEKYSRLVRLADLQQDYDVVFGTDQFNYGESIDFTGCTNLKDVAQRLREKADELEELEKRGWSIDGVDGEWLMAKMPLDWEK